MERKICILGGTFDPVHLGHLNLATELFEKNGLDEVWWVPAQANPFKNGTPPIAFEHRAAMVRLAIEGIPSFLLKETEKNHSAPTYMIDTLHSSIKESPSFYRFYLLLGEDTALRFNEWKSSEELRSLAPILIASRSMKISSTEVRQRLLEGRPCEHLLPAAVLRYIQAHKLYCI